MNTERLQRILQKLKEKNLSQMIISDPLAIYYLTGRLIDPGERLLALYISQSGNNRIFINNLFTVPEDLGVEKVRFSDTDDSIALPPLWIFSAFPVSNPDNGRVQILLFAELLSVLYIHCRFLP